MNATVFCCCSCCYSLHSSSLLAFYVQYWIFLAYFILFVVHETAVRSFPYVVVVVASSFCTYPSSSSLIWLHDFGKCIIHMVCAWLDWHHIRHMQIKEERVNIPGRRPRRREREEIVQGLEGYRVVFRLSFEKIYSNCDVYKSVTTCDLWSFSCVEIHRRSLFLLRFLIASRVVMIIIISSHGRNIYK